MVARGEVWWYEAPGSSRRPYLILTRDEAIGVLNQLVAVPATRTVRGIPTEVALDRSHGMPGECALTLDNISLVRKSLCVERITTLGADVMDAVCMALRRATGC